MMRILSLLMLSNVVVAIGIASTVALSAHAETEEVSSAEMESLLKQQFSEPLPKVIQRANREAKVMPVTEAWHAVGHKMPDEVHALLQEGRNTTQKSMLRATSSPLADSKVFDKAMAFINNEYKIVREELDLELLECGFFKLQKESVLFETQDKLDSIAMDMGLAEATMNACQAEIQKQNDIIEVKSLELYKLTTWCQAVHDQLAAIKSAAEEDLRVINLIIETAKKECAAGTSSSGFLQVQACLGSAGTTHFESNNRFVQEQAGKFTQVTSQQAFQQALFELYGYDTPLPGKLNLQALGDFDDDDSDDFPDEEGQSLIQLNKKDAPSAGTSNRASNDAQRERCSIAGPPECSKLMDKLGQMQSQLYDALNKAIYELQKHDTQCENDKAELNKEIQTARDIIATNTAEYDKASAFHNGMLIEHGQEAAFKRQLCKELRDKFKACYKKLKELERQMCGMLKIRQAVYNKIKNPDGAKPQLLISDCMMSDWVVGECSGTCLDANGNSGIQIIKRAPLEEWSNKTDEGKYGVSCPPDEVTRTCATEHCPIDCVMSDWSKWSECTAQCGGGSETRTRSVLTPEEHGGTMCGASSQSDACNTQSCDADCVLADWGPWGPCSKSCLADYRFPPGKHTREKKIAVPTIGQGECPKPRTPERWEEESCNVFKCPKNIQCVADLDVVLVQDGSGSLYYPCGWWCRKKTPEKMAKNFNTCRSFMEHLVGASKIAKNDDFGYPKNGLRYGVVLYSWRAKVISQITEKKDELLAAIKGMKWPRGGTYTGRALDSAAGLFKVAQGAGKRLQVIVLITDGRASRRRDALQAAIRVKNSGIRLIIVPVKRAVRLKAEMCRWASHPCNQNMIMTKTFNELNNKLKLYLTTMCPTVEDPSLSSL